MHIAVVAGHAPSLVRFRGRLLKDMLLAGHKVTTLGPTAPVPPDPEHDETMRALADMGVAYEPVPLYRQGMNPLEDLRSTAALTKRFKLLEPDLVFNYTIKPVIWGSMAAQRAGIERIASLVSGLGRAFSIPEGGIWTKARGAALQGLVTRLYRKALAANEIVLFQNTDDEDLFRNRAMLARGVPSMIVPGSGVDLDEFPAVDPAPPPPVFLCMARLLKEKGVLEYAEAARRLRRLFPQVLCLLAGPSEEGPGALDTSEIDRWKKEDGVEYVGAATDVRPLLARCTAFVLPSYYGEGLPRSSLEALASARPVITTDHPGCREAVIPEQTGLLVAPRDVDSLAAAMTRFIQDPELSARMGRAAREQAEARFDVRIVNRMILEALKLVKPEAREKKRR